VDIQENKGIQIMQKLSDLKGKYIDADGNDLFVGGTGSYIKPQEYAELARKHHFELYKSFPIDDQTIIEEVAKYLQKNRMVLIVAWTEEKRIDLYLEPL
jgi:hypothetical protein